MLNSVERALTESRWMVEKDPTTREKRPVKVFSAQMKNAKPVPTDVMRTFMYEGAGNSGGGGGEHEIDYIQTRAPRIGGEVYSGISIAKAARPTIDTGNTKKKQKMKRDRRKLDGGHNQKWEGPSRDSRDNTNNNNNNKQGGHNNVLAKSMRVRLPQATGSRRQDDNNNNLPEILESHFYNPQLIHQQQQQQLQSQSLPTNALDKILSHQARLQKNGERDKEKRMKTRKTNSSYGNPKSNNKLSPGSSNNIIVLEKLSSSFFHSEDDDSTVEGDKIEQERKKLEKKLNYYKVNLDNYRSLNDKQLAHYSKLTKESSASLPLNYIFRKAVDKYKSVKCGSAWFYWRRYVELHRAYCLDLEFKSSKASIIQRLVRCHLARKILSSQRARHLRHLHSTATYLQNCWRRKQAFDIFRLQKSKLVRANENLMAIRIQSKFRSFLLGDVAARKLLRVELFKSLKCLAGRSPLHRVPFLPGLMKSEKANFEVMVELATHGGTPYRTLATQRVFRKSIEMCWVVIRRREAAGKAKREQWKKTQEMKEEMKKQEKLDRLNSAKERQRKADEEERARIAVEKLNKEEAEAAKRLQARLDKEIESMAKLEDNMSRLEREKMHGEEIRQKESQETLLAGRKRDIDKEISHMEHEDRAGHDLIVAELEERERQKRLEFEEKKRAEFNGQSKEGSNDGKNGKRHNKLRFHHKHGAHARRKKEIQEKKKKQLDIHAPPQRQYRIPQSLLRPPRRTDDSMYRPHPFPSVMLMSERGSLLRIWCVPVATDEALEAERHIQSMRQTNAVYSEALLEVAD